MPKFAERSVSGLSHCRRLSLLQYDGPICQAILPSVNSCDTLMLGPERKVTVIARDKFTLNC